jgi:Ca2+-binding RTX toxin-like protein
MTKQRTALFVLCIAFVSFAPIGASPVDGFVDEEKEWRQVYETTGLTWSQVASVCPRDGATPCSGSVAGKNLSGWVWATAEQVLGLMDNYVPTLSMENPSVSGPEYMLPAAGFLGVMRWTTYVSLTYHYSEYTGGWTASTNADGLPIAGGASYQHPFFDGSLGVGAAPDEASPYRGVFLWRTAGLDYTGPVVTPVVTGTMGNNGWFVSNVGVRWNVSDPESAITSTEGCEPSSVVTDSAGTTFACTATSAGLGGPTTASTTVKRDVARPTLACASPAPVFELGQFNALVRATVTDAVSGPTTPTVGAYANTSLVGSFTATLVGKDLAGNQATKNCGYKIAAASCRGLAATKVGTTGNDVITGTAGRDIISALAGADTIDGLGGGDVICGGDGPDTVYGGGGADVIDGGATDDDLNGGSGNDNIDGGLGTNDSVRGDAGKDTCTSGERRMSSCEVLV